MIVIGLNQRAKTVKSGSFDCPYCGVTRLYDLKQAKLYFSFFFIPLIPLRDEGEYIECQHCFHRYAPAAAERRATSAVERWAAEVERDLLSGTPLGMGRQKLANHGLAADFIDEVMVQAQSGHLPLRNCGRCGKQYVAEIDRCAECGNSLTR